MAPPKKANPPKSKAPGLTGSKPFKRSISITPGINDQVQAEADRNDREFSAEVRVLLTEALTARKKAAA